ncbi:unnamed protein product [Candidula unifasciata]|uniref:Uncharacterized protein n=1 Tax=Candidula unifasciata TaxID=100452 RepID=A0A8S3ZZL4_9EUPU|nr:unnamed protein product [Candidula unifasciata]
MYIQLSTETILTSLILVSRVWSRPSGAQCGGQRGEGHKWFDGCQWCVCQHGRSTCTSSDCSIISSQLPACHGNGSSWLDGCYSCKCDLKTIECTPDKACLRLVHRHGLETDATENGACEQPADEQCIRGIDGVPSCKAEVIDRDALPAVTAELNPLFTSSSSSKQHYGKTEGRLTNKEILKLVFDSERNRIALSRQVFGHHTGGHSVLKPGQSAKSSGQTISEVKGASLLVVKADRCRLGERWYGGSLRCYCGKDNSITCGDPSFVVSRIDGFRLVTGDCVEGHAWEDKESCTVCKCQNNGLAFCSRSPSCPLPFIVKTLPLDTDADRNFEIVKRDQQLDEESQFAGEGEHNLVWNKRAEQMLGYSREGRELTLDKTNKATGDFNIPKSKRTLDQQWFEEKSTINYDDVVDGSGDSNLPATATTWAEDGDMKTTDIQVSTTTSRRAIPITSEGSTKTVTNPNSSLYESLTASIRAATGKCTPRTTWVERGCNRCVCNSQGDKKCNDSRCRTSTTAPYTTSTEITTNCIGNNPRCRPMIRPPPEHIWNRTQPIVPSNPPGLLDCGRFKPGEKFWEDCNLCECTTSGPLCTAKNCS